jgi:hypothetical protein
LTSLPADNRRRILELICQQAGVTADGARLLRAHADSIWLLPAASAVVKLAVTSDAARRGRNAVAVIGWLRSLNFPCIDPLPLDQPVTHAGCTATFWRFAPPPAEPRLPDPGVLGVLVRRLHTAPQPPFVVPTYQPTARLRAAIRADSHTLNDAQRRWLQERIASLTEQYEQLDTHLGTGLIHNDAHLGNLLPTGTGWLLADWDRVATGPREWDLVPVANDARFGLPPAQRAVFATAYGVDVTTWPGWPVLRDLHELHSLAAHIRAAPTKPAAERELHWRLNTLQHGDRHRVWHAVP